MNKKGTIAIGQVIILMIAIVGFAWIIGGMQRVSAGSGDPCSFTKENKNYTGECIDASKLNKDNNGFLSSQEVDGKSCILGDKEGIFKFGECGNNNMNSCCGVEVSKEKKEKNDGGLNGGKPKIQSKKDDFEGLYKKLGEDVIKELSESKIDELLNESNITSGEADFLKRLLNAEIKGDDLVGTLKGLTTSTFGYFLSKKLSDLLASGSLTGKSAKILNGALARDTTGKLFGSSIAYTAAAIVSAAAAAFTFSKIFRMIGGNPDQQNLLGSFGAAAAATATIVFGYPTTFQALQGILGLGGLATAGIISGAVFVVFAIFSSSVAEQGVVIYNCQPWDAATGGENCELCNNQEVPCSEYQCKSLGQSCLYIGSDQDQGGRPFCFFNNSRDVDPPVISPNEGVLSIGYRYTPNNAISPPDRGVKIIDSKSKDGCLSPFSKVTFGVKLDEPAKCKIDFQRRKSYDKMSLPFGRPYLDYNHTQTLLIPDLNNSLGKDNQISTYVKCIDSNGNSNKNDFVFEMCVQEGPDNTPPIIYGTSIKKGSKVPFNVTSANVDFYINEPAECRWSFSDEKYENMENNMTCATNPKQMNLRLSYTCSTNLTGIKSQEKTDYFIRCRDQPNLKNINDRNTNVESYKYNLQSSRALVIAEASPNGTTIKGSTSPATITLKARTLGGTYDGNALCYSSPDGVEGNYKEFENSGSTNKHSTEIHLEKGNYQYYIKCLDFGGNVDVKKINFSVDIDQEAPIVVRAYYEDGSMKLITDEKAECRYSTSTLGCEYSFDDGIKIKSYNKIDHFVKWDTETNLYIKCQDIYGNQPKTNECNIVVRAQNGQNF